MRYVAMCLLITGVYCSDNAITFIKTESKGNEITITLSYNGVIKPGRFAYIEAESIKVGFRNGDAGWDQEFTVNRIKSSLCVYEEDSDKVFTVVGMLKQEIIRGSTGGVLDMALAASITVGYNEMGIRDYVHSTLSGLSNIFKEDLLFLK
jgi:hypothetical protein